jgi:hypothetical protein
VSVVHVASKDTWINSLFVRGPSPSRQMAHRGPEAHAIPLNIMSITLPNLCTDRGHGCPDRECVSRLVPTPNASEGPGAAVRHPERRSDGDRDRGADRELARIRVPRCNTCDEWFSSGLHRARRMKNEGCSTQRAKGAGFGGEEKAIDRDVFRDRRAPGPGVRESIERPGRNRRCGRLLRAPCSRTGTRGWGNGKRLGSPGRVDE